MLDPHELLVSAAQWMVGSALPADILDPLTTGVVEQLSVYEQVVPAATVRLRRTWVKPGEGAWYVMAELSDRGRPLRLRDAFLLWRVAVSNEHDFVATVNTRRGHFVERHLSSLLAPLWRRVADLLVAVRREHPYTVPALGTVRLLEDVERTVLCIELTLRADEDSPSRWRV